MSLGFEFDIYWISDGDIRLHWLYSAVFSIFVLMKWSDAVRKSWSIRTHFSHLRRTTMRSSSPGWIGSVSLPSILPCYPTFMCIIVAWQHRANTKMRCCAMHFIYLCLVPGQGSLWLFILIFVEIEPTKFIRNYCREVQTKILTVQKKKKL